MNSFTKLDQIRKHLGLEPSTPIPASEPKTIPLRAFDSGPRVQKNLTILVSDAERLVALSKRDGVSQARLLSAALNAYERMQKQAE